MIWFPLDDRVYEIKDIEYAKPYYQLQDLYTYELTCELFRYEDEVIDTGIDDIDDNLVGDDPDGTTDDGINTIQGTTTTLTMVGTASQATAETGIVDGGIQWIHIQNRGGGYIYAPSIGIGSAPAGGLTGIATAHMLGGIVVCTDSANPKAQVVQDVRLINPGYGYTSGPGITFTGGGDGVCVSAAATAKAENGTIGIITMTSGGSGYTTSPTITFTGVSTTGAAATAVVSAAGTISAIHITNAGAGYSTAPTISIAAPGTSSTGNFSFNELVTGGTSGTTARVRTWDGNTNILELASVDGTFTLGETLTGSVSGATRDIRIIDTVPDNEEYADNFDIETAADEILDFSEQNPFGQP